MAKFKVTYDRNAGSRPKDRIRVDQKRGNICVQSGDTLEWKIQNAHNLGYLMKIIVHTDNGDGWDKVSNSAAPTGYQECVKLPLDKWPADLDWFKYEIEMNQPYPTDSSPNDRLDPVIIVGSGNIFFKRLFLAGIALVVGIGIGFAFG